jgi:site-specific recombinase XerD
MESLTEIAAAVSDLIVEVPNRRKWFSLRKDQLPPELAADVDDWLSAEQGADTRLRRARLNRTGRRRRKPIGASTAASYLRLLLEFITMEVQAGIPLESLSSLADVVDLDNVDRGLAKYQAHFNGEPRRHLGQVMRIVCLVARHWVGVDQDHDAELWVWTRDVSVSRHGMTPKNKALLMSLRDPHAQARLFGLPEKVMRKVLAKPPITESDAVRAQVAFAVAVLLSAPARIFNIASIHIDRHLRRVGSDAEERVFLEFPGVEVKNERDLMYELNEPAKLLFGPYMARIRPKLVGDPQNRHLFPGESDGPKGSALLSQQIGDLTEEIVGIRITAHQFRHIMGFLHLSRSGNDIATVAKALGNDEATARGFYAWLPQEEALKNWNETLKLKREELAPLIDGTGPKKRRRRRSKA